jgi:hypothetical protein
MKHAPAARPSRGRGGILRVLIGIIFLIFGFISFAKVAGMNLGVNLSMLDPVTAWVTAIGCALGGLYIMLFKPRIFPRFIGF